MVRARDLMTTHVTTVTPAMSLSELESALLSEGVGGAPVVVDGRVVGVVSRSDIVRELAEERERAEEAVAEYFVEPVSGASAARNLLLKESDLIAQQMAKLTVRDIMRTRVIHVGPDASAVDVARQLVRYRVHRVLVTENEELLGIISSLDLVHLLAEPARAAASQPVASEEVVSFAPDLNGERSALFPGDADVAVLREDSGGGTTLLARLRPDGRIDAHANPGAVQHFVLSGQYESEGRVYREGTFRLLPKGEVPLITSSDGAVILIVFDPGPS